jgi:hypothetical protein
MTIGEANNLNTLLRYLLDLVDPAHISDTPQDDARAAAVELADRAYKALYAGITGDDVLRRWARREAPPVAKGGG